MKRLTERHDHGIKMAAGYDFGIDPDDYDLVQKILARLAAYEDTGLEPEEVNRCKLTLMGKSLAEITEFDGVSIERLKELVRAEKGGRLVACRAR